MTAFPRLSTDPGTRPKVLHVITGLNIGGAERSLSQLLKDSQSQLREALVVSLTAEGHYHDVIVKLGIPVVSLDMRRGHPSLRGLIKLARIIRAFQPDVVQSWMYHADLLALLALWLSGRRRQTRLYWGIRNTHIARFERRRLLDLTIRLSAFLSRAPDLIIVNSRAGRDDHLAIGYAPERMRVIHNGVETDRFRPDPLLRRMARDRLGLDPSAFVAITVARCHQMKGYPSFRSALALMPEVVGLAAGDGTELLSSPANLTGIGIRHDIEAILNAADVYVSSSLYGEGCSNSILEAMACGLPVVATSVGDSAHIVGNAGIIVPPDDSAAIARAVRTIRDDADLRLRMSRRARARATEVFPQRASSRAFIGLYAGLRPSLQDMSSEDEGVEESLVSVPVGRR